MYHALFSLRHVENLPCGNETKEWMEMICDETKPIAFKKAMDKGVILNVEEFSGVDYFSLIELFEKKEQEK